MNRSFYEFLMSKRDPHKRDNVTLFANAASEDQAFPKQSQSFEEISNYLELQGDYIDSMAIFDEVWRYYLDNQKRT